MNAIQKFAEEHGTDDSASLEQAFKSAVQSVIGNKGKVIDAWNDGGSIGYCDWHCSVKGVDGMAPNTEFMLTLTTNEQNGRSWLACQYDNDDCDILGDADGTVGEFDPFPLFNKCLGKSESRKPSCSMQKKKESLAKKNEGKSIDEILEILRSDKYKEDAKRLRDAYQEFETLARRLGYRLVIPNFDGYAPTVLPEDVIDDVMDLLPLSYKQSGDLVDNSQIVGNVCPFIFD